VFGATYTKQEAVSTANRAISLFPTSGITSCAVATSGCSSAIPNGRFDVLGQSLTLVAPVVGRKPVYPTDFRAYTLADRFNFAPYNYLITPNERIGGFFNFKQELSSSVNLRVKLVYNHRHSTTEAAFLPLFIGPDAGNGNLLDTISVDATNPYNPFGVTLSSGADGTPANYSTIRRRFVEGGQRVFTQDVNTFSGTVTLDGSFFLGSKKWYWDANAVVGLNDAHQLFTGNLNAAKLAKALGPVANCTGDCVPFNIFGGLGSITPAMLNYVTFDERDKSTQRLYDYTANLSGELFDLPAGPVGIAIGYEHRVQKASYDPDPVIVAGLGADVPTSPARGGFNVDEVYGELRVPILANTPFFYRLELDGAVRHSDYSSFGRRRSSIGSNSTARSAIRTIRRSAAARPSPPPACGNPSPTCCSAAAMPRAFARRASANSMRACRAATRRSTIPAPAAPAARSSPTRRSGRIASPMACRPTAATMIRPADSSACSPRAMRR